MLGGGRLGEAKIVVRGCDPVPGYLGQNGALRRSLGWYVDR
jgi:hypothetical protein